MKQDSNCIKPANYPFEVWGQIAELIGENSVISCGGRDYTNGRYSSACYDYDLTSSTWKSIANMNTPRESAASVVIDGNQIWITGGYNYDDGYLKSTEIFHV